MSWWGIVGCLVLLVAYMLYPEPFHDFFKFLIDTVLESVRDAFGTSDDGGAKDSGQLRINPDDPSQNPQNGKR